MTAQVLKDSNKSQEFKPKSQHLLRPNLEEIDKRHAALQASGTLQIARTPVSSQETLCAYCNLAQNLGTIQERYQALQYQQDQEGTNCLLAEIEGMKASNCLYPALQ